MTATATNWFRLLKETTGPLILPSAHDAITANIIQQAGFPAYQIGGFSLAGARHCLPDIDLQHLGEASAAVQDIIAATTIPVMVDADDGYGDVKNVTNTVKVYERLGVSAIFIEDQKPPKRCGHLTGKEVIPAQEAARKIKAAVAARDKTTFILARTDATAVEGIEGAIERAKRYLDAGAHGIYIEGPESQKELERAGNELSGHPLATSILETGGKTPWLPPSELYQMGYTMILYPTTILFQVARTTKRAVERLKTGQPMPTKEGYELQEFEQMIGMGYWADIESSD